MVAEILIALAGAIIAAILTWQWRRQRTRAESAGRALDVLRGEHVALTARHEALESSHAALKREHQSHDAEEHRMFDFLHELGEALYSDTSARKLHRRIVRGASEVVEARGGALYLHDAQRGLLVPSALTRECPPLIELPPEVLEKIGGDTPAVRSHVRLQSVLDGAGALGDVFDSGRPMLLRDLREHPSFAHLPGARTGRVLSVMIAPLIYGAKKLGVLAVAQAGAGRAFTAHDFDVFRSIAEQSAFALGSAMIHQEAMEKRRIEDELTRASEIQRILLPSRPPDFSGFTLAGACQPAKVVSGDYYDFIRLDETHLGVVVADVSGKGVPASLVMATCRGLMRVSAEQQPSPIAVLQQVNRLLFADIREDMFVSLAYCVLDSTSGEVTLVRAGHDPPLLFRRAHGAIEPLKPPGLALGIDRGPVFNRATQEFSFRMEPGDRLLLYTDGVTEALESKSRDEFGSARLTDVFKIQSQAGVTPQSLLASVQSAVASFTKGARQHDDITLVVIERV
ncbi:MAG: PP2C family protein-serine/threonine phosphatase [Verrucomicrobiales bacterium]